MFKEKGQDVVAGVGGCVCEGCDGEEVSQGSGWAIGVDDSTAGECAGWGKLEVDFWVEI